MGTLLSRGFAAAVAAACAFPALAAENDRHVLELDVAAAVSFYSTDLDAWPDGGLSKLSRTEDGVAAARVFAEYRGRLTPTLHARIVADYVDAGASGIDVTEAFIDWRPVPSSPNQQQWRFGAFYPPFSLENGERGWQSPFTYSYSAINTWLGEEIRPIGAEWSLRRRLQGGHELRTFAAGFYGNDPAATLLFWRGWALHDRQTRLDDRLAVPPLPLPDGFNTLIPQPAAPFTEIDHRPGAYLGVEWRRAQRALVQVAHYDNRADPTTFTDGVWGWHTRFDHVAAQVSLPAELGLVVQWMRGSTYWISGALPDGSLWPAWRFVEDDFESQFVLLTRELGRNRLSVRYDSFDTRRPGLHSDSGHAWTLALRFEPTERLRGGVEWLRVVSSRRLWSRFYSTAEQQSEEQLRVQWSYRLGLPTKR